MWIWIVLILVILLIVFLLMTRSGTNSSLNYPITLNNMMNANQVAVPNLSKATGGATVKVLSPTSIEYDLMVRDIQPNSVAYIGMGAAHQKGEPLHIIYLTPIITNDNKIVYQSKNVIRGLKPSIVNNLLNGNCFLEVANHGYPQGEIRGRLNRSYQQEV